MKNKKFSRGFTVGELMFALCALVGFALSILFVVAIVHFVAKAW